MWFCRLLPFVLLAGCLRQDTFISNADRILFQHFGTTIFVNPSQLSMKEIHLDSAILRGKEVIISGDVIEVSEHFTYMVIGDEQARMLVVLTGLESAGPALRRNKPKTVKVLGVVENGQKGMPHVVARSLNLLDSPNKA